MNVTSAEAAGIKKKPKRLTQEEIEEEAERVRLAEEQAAADLKEFLRYKHVTPLELNATTHDPMPSMSPRDQLSYAGDKKALKEITKFREHIPNLNKFMLRLHTEVLVAKPDNIIKWVDRYFFSHENIELMRKELEMPEPEAGGAKGGSRPSSQQNDSRPNSRK